MILIPGAVKIYVATQPVSLRKSFESIGISNWCARKSLAREERRHDGTLKLEGAAQRVQVPSGQSPASRPVVSLA